eukprot:Phypoly_transcript_06576.p1 GENE.Phypoly_transcript_06576~~Phypoly_transcript_06576.p1  ORF type:complete len:551 (+),score=51.01 Phypoly_transcript_06576:87-1739(+)
MSVILVVLLFFAILGVCYGFNPSEYSRYQQIHPRYSIFWNVDEGAQKLHLALKVQTTGWVGFGFGELTSGSMPGADIVIGQVQQGIGSISDRYSEAYSLPKEDSCQDWILVASEESEGFTILELARALDTQDAQDRIITPGLNKILIAFGESDTVSYHSVNRQTSEITFFGAPPALPSHPADAKSIEFLIKNYSVGNGQTHFGCMTFVLPDDQKYYIYQLDAIIQPETAPHIHHFQVHICSNVSDGSVPRHIVPGDCRDNPAGGISGCNGVLYGWAPGGGSAVLPAVTGFPMGAREGSVKYLVLEIHYDNPDGKGGYQDNSGFRVWYTKQPRQYDADSLAIGDPYVLFKTSSVIPPLAITEYEAECPSECTQTLPHEITIFTSSPHMHYVGSQIWTSQWRNGTQISEFGRVEYWSFENQGQQLMSLTIKPGDRLNTHCIYDSRNKNTPTVFGPASTDEMCIHFLGYYPRIPGGFHFCGYGGATKTICGDHLKGLLNYSNPTIRDPPGGANRTFGREGSQCQNAPYAVFSIAGSLEFSFILLFWAIASLWL